MDTPTLEQLTTVAGATILVVVLLQVIWATVKPSPATKDQFGPLTALVVGVAVTVVATFALGTAGSQNLAGALINGIFAGAAAMGVHDTAKSAGIG